MTLNDFKQKSIPEIMITAKPNMIPPGKEDDLPQKEKFTWEQQGKGCKKLGE